VGPRVNEVTNYDWHLKLGQVVLINITPADVPKVGHGLDPSMDWIELDWVGDYDPFLISTGNHCSQTDVVSFKL